MNSNVVFDQTLMSLKKGPLMHYGHRVVVLLSLLVTLFAWQVSESSFQVRRQQQFEREAERAIDLLQERLRYYEVALLSGVSNIQMLNGEVSRAQWKQYAQVLNLTERYPGINGIGVIKYVKEDDLGQFLNDVKLARRDQQFAMHPKQQHDVHLPIIYIEPEETNDQAIGLDIAFEKNRRDAAFEAIYSGDAQISAPVKLVQDLHNTPGFLFLLPFYLHQNDNTNTVYSREDLFGGFVYAPLIVKNLVESVPVSTNHKLAMTIFDQGANTLLYGSPEEGLNEGKTDLIYKTQMYVYGRAWLFTVLGLDYTDTHFLLKRPSMILIMGLLIDAILLIVFMKMASFNKRITTLSNELAERADELTASNQNLKNFAHIVSHDLKAPVQNIQCLSDFLDQDLQPYMSSLDASPQVKVNLERLKEQAVKSQALITGILDYSVVGFQDEPLAMADCAVMLKSIQETLMLRPDQLVVKGVPPAFLTRAVKLEQVLSNMISNAFKYNPNKTGAMVWVHFNAQDDCFKVSIKDNGPGIEKELHESIFNEFSTTQAVRNIDSTGIGLSIVKKAVYSIGGEISVESEMGAGTTFHFTWPVVIAEVTNSSPKA